MKVWILQDYYNNKIIGVFKKKNSVLKRLKEMCIENHWDDIKVNTLTMRNVLKEIGLTYELHDLE